MPHSQQLRETRACVISSQQKQIIVDKREDQEGQFARLGITTIEQMHTISFASGRYGS